MDICLKAKVSYQKGITGWNNPYTSNYVEGGPYLEFDEPFTHWYFLSQDQMVTFELHGSCSIFEGKLAEYNTTLASLATNNYASASYGLKNREGEEIGAITFENTEVEIEKSFFKVKVRCNGLKSKKKMMGMVSTNHPVLKIRKFRDGFDPCLENCFRSDRVHETEVIDDSLDPEWLQFSLCSETIFDYGVDVPFLWEVWSNEVSSEGKIYGRVLASYNDIRSSDTKTFDIIKKNGKPYGEMKFETFKHCVTPQLQDYFRSSYSFTLSFIIDFSSVFGDQSSNPHFMKDEETRLNPFEKAISAVGNHLFLYSNCNAVNMLGFGAIPNDLGADSSPDSAPLLYSQDWEVDNLVSAYK